MSNQAAVEQPAPQPGSEEVLTTAVRCAQMGDYSEIIPDLIARAEQGKERYGTYLMAHNGRDAVMDCYQEVLDGIMYVTQAMMECGTDDERYALVPVRLYLTFVAKRIKKLIDAREL